MSNRPSSAAPRRGGIAELPACFLKLGVVAPTSAPEPVNVGMEPLLRANVEGNSSRIYARPPVQAAPVEQVIYNAPTAFPTMKVEVERAVPSAPVPVREQDIGTRLADARRARHARMNAVDRQQAQNAEQRAARARQRVQQGRNRRGQQLAAARLPTARDMVLRYLTEGFIKMQLVFNVEDGYVILSQQGYGLPLSAQQIAYLDQQTAELRRLGLPPVQRQPWENFGILNYAPALSALREVGFAQFANFFGEGSSLRWGMEYPLLQELDLYRPEWAMDPAQVFDNDYAAGGIGPYMTRDDTFAQADLLQDVSMEPEPMSIQLQQMIAQDRAAYDEYMRERMQNPGTYDADRQLPVAPPTAQERGEGMVPPSVAGGNPGLEPIPEGNERAGSGSGSYSPQSPNYEAPFGSSSTRPPEPPQNTVVSWADELVCIALQQSINEGLIRPAPNKPNLARLNMILDRAFDPLPNENDSPDLVRVRDEMAADIQQNQYEPSFVKLAVSDVLENYKSGAKPWPTCLAVGAATDIEPIDDVPSPSYSPQSPVYDRGGTGDPNSSQSPRDYMDTVESVVALIRDFVLPEAYESPPYTQAENDVLVSITDLGRLSRAKDIVLAKAPADLVPDDLDAARDAMQEITEGRVGTQQVHMDNYNRARNRLNSLLQRLENAMRPNAPPAPRQDDSSSNGPAAAAAAAFSQLRPASRPTGPADPPPTAADNARSVQEVQVATIQRAALMGRPAASAYHPIVDMRQNASYKKAIKYAPQDFPPDPTARQTFLMKALIPTVRFRSDFFYLKTDPVEELTYVDTYLSDTTEVVTFAPYKNVINGRRPPLYPARQFTLSDREITGEEPAAIIKNIYSVQADNEQSMGFFGEHQLQHMYKHMCIDGKVMFSINSGKAIQFFPDEFVCSNIWWWESKISFMPSSLRWDRIGSGSFNVANVLRNTDSTSNPPSGRLPDHFLFLPPMRVAYGVSLQQPGIDKMFAPTKQNGIIMRVATYDHSDPYGLQRMIREIMLGGLAASNGFGPRIFAAYVIPDRMYPPAMRMNPGDVNACFADPLYRAESKQGDIDAEPHNAPIAPFYDNPMLQWNAAGIAQLQPSAGIQRIEPRTLGPEFKDHRTEEWHKMVVVMESFAGDMANMRPTEAQKTKIIAELWKVMEKMSATGMLHMDNKYLNCVQRTWRRDGQEVTRANPWDEIEIRVIDFDPKFVKLCPWLPTDVVMLINISCFLAFDRCFSGGNDLYRKALPRLRALQTKVNEKYPDGIAGAFRAILPGLDTARGPRSIPGVAGYSQNPRQSRSDYAIFQMFNDEWEAARAFSYYVKNYFEDRYHGCTWEAGRPDGASMLAQILSTVKHGTTRRAQLPQDQRRPGVFDVAAAPTPPCKVKVEKEKDGVMGGIEGEGGFYESMLYEPQMGRGLWNDVYNYGKM